MDETGLRLTRGTDVPALASGLLERLTSANADPFEAPLVLVPGAAMRRWLSQVIARADAEGICAGVRFESLARLETLLTGREDADDPWAPQRLGWRILELVDSGTPGLERLAHHLSATDQRYANASRVAFLLDRYARLRPGLLRSWSAAEGGDDLGLGIDAWQAALWRALHGVVPGPDPVARHDALLADLGAGRRGLDAPAVAVFAPRQLTAADADLLGALAQRRRVDVWLRIDSPASSANPLAGRLGGRGAETAALLAERAASVVDLPAPVRPPTLLGALQADLDAGVPPRRRTFDPGDRSLDVHAAHGPARQAEVLREVLAGLFADDPGLEPRHVVIACPDPSSLAPHLSAVFTGEAGPDAHPGLTFRVRVAESGAADANELYALVRDVAQLGSTRATAGQLLALASHPFVARRFGLADDDLERLGDLVRQASVRWGLGDAHRRLYGLDKVRQGTWQIGVQRLLLGEALSDDSLASVGVIAPVDDVESSDVDVVGALAELVSRVTRLTRRPDRASAAEWVAHFRAIADQLADLPFESGWQQAQLWAVLDLLARRSAGSPVPLGPADAVALLDAEFHGLSGRPSFGDGSLVVCSLAALAKVPHRVVCLVGLDERVFPRRGLRDGDDLLAASPCPGEPDPGRDDRQLLLDALGAATERLVVIYQGWSSHTREHRPPPSGVIDVVEVARATGASDDLVIDEPLQPFSPTLFEAPPRSFDVGALRSARALVSPRRATAPERYVVGRLPLPDEVVAVDLEQVRTFLGHPAKYFLRERAQLSLGDDRPPAEELPLEVDSLGRWAIGDRLLGLLLRGHSVQDAQHAEWLRGDLPPGELGRRILDDVTAVALRVASDAEPFADAPVGLHVIDLDVEGVRLSGRATTRGDIMLSTGFSKVSARQLAPAWLDALALTVQLGHPVDAVLLGGGRRSRLSAPDPEAARALLGTLVALAVEGRQRILPLPPRVSHLWAQARARNADPLADRNLESRWSWEKDATWTAVLQPGERPWSATATGDPWAQRGEKSLLGSLAAVAWRPLVKAER